MSDFILPQNVSWSLRNILKCRNLGLDLNSHAKPKSKDLYEKIRHVHEKKDWRALILNNKARPRAWIISWLVLWRRVATKDRIQKFGIQTDKKCVFCDADENIPHLFMDCLIVQKMWRSLTLWAGFDHSIQTFEIEQEWIIEHTKGKKPANQLLKMIYSEFIYHIWKKRNEIIFGTGVFVDHIMLKDIVLNVLVKCSQVKKLRDISLHLNQYPF